MPHVDSSKIRLPGRSCVAYMHIAELATISRAHKAAQLIQSKQWHLSSDGTTVHQEKKFAFLLNNLVIGIHNVPNGTSQAALQAVRHKLDKIKKVADKLSYNTDKIGIQNIFSFTSDGAST